MQSEYKWHFFFVFFRVGKMEKLHNRRRLPFTGAPNDQFVVKCIIIAPVNENKLRHFQVFFSVAGKTLSVPFSQQDTQ